MRHDEDAPPAHTPAPAEAAPPSPPVRRTARRATGRVTLDDVAREAGVSAITASRALRGTRGVDAALAERVHAAAARLGYVPDPAARALASAHSQHVAVLIPMLSNTLFVELLESVQRTLTPAGYQTLIGVTHYRPDEEEALLRSYLAHRPAGLLVTGFDRTPAAQALIDGSGLPCVHMMETRQAPGVHSVGFSQQAAGRAITEHLLARGRRRIAYVAGQMDPRVMQRAEGWRAALRAAGCHDPALELMDPTPTSMALGGRLFRELMARHPDVDGIFFCNDDLAQGALLAALRMGIAVPQQVAMAGFNDLAGSDQMIPPLTSVRTPRAEVGAQAATLLLGLMRGQQPAQPTVDVGFELVVRQSS
ncbi:LacI family DNA-binding transcriptional regulator [Ideonella sp. DXS22W]|uniref:LacI family DNA-binding transcriptional regulator n=1 Tax=Pseudaquabacterium inlustre TaxID=2984192 RepID=A0ABU9CGE0_9BURK